jgi:hypothetical protein
MRRRRRLRRWVGLGLIVGAIAAFRNRKLAADERRFES